MDTRTDRQKHFLLSIAYWVVIIAIVYFIFKYLLNLLMPFLLAAIFAALSRPLAQFLSRDADYRKGKNGAKIAVKRRFHLTASLAGIISVVLIYVIIGSLLVLVFFRLADSITALVAAIPDVYTNSVLPGLSAFLQNVEILAARFDESVLEMVQQAIPNLISSLGSAVTTFSAKAVSWLSSFAGKLPSFLLSTVICVIASVFMAVDFDNILQFIRRNLPARPLEIVTDVKNSFLEIIWQFVKSYFIIFCITATEVAVGLLIIGMGRPVLLGVLIAIFDAFPIVGSGMILLPWAVITLITGATWRGVGLMILYVVVVLVRQIIEPRIVGKHVGLRPLVTLMCMYVGSRLFGGLGLLGLPISAAILTDMNNSGLIHLYKRSEPAATPEGKGSGA